MKVLDIITLDQLRQLRSAGFVVIHREPTQSMRKAALRDEYPEDRSVVQVYHRMVGESIRLQNTENCASSDRMYEIGLAVDLSKPINIPDSWVTWPGKENGEPRPNPMWYGKDK